MQGAKEVTTSALESKEAELLSTTKAANRARHRWRDAWSKTRLLWQKDSIRRSNQFRGWVCNTVPLRHGVEGIRSNTCIMLLWCCMGNVIKGWRITIITQTKSLTMQLFHPRRIYIKFSFKSQSKLLAHTSFDPRFLPIWILQDHKHWCYVIAHPQSRIPLFLAK